MNLSYILQFKCRCHTAEHLKFRVIADQSEMCISDSQPFRASHRSLPTNIANNK